MFDNLPFELTLQLFIHMSVVLAIAGLIKGVVGFGMPLVVMSGVGGFYGAEPALVALVVPTFASNVIQGLRDGTRAALETVKRYRLLLLIMSLMIILSAQLLSGFTPKGYFIFLGSVVLIFATIQIAGWKPNIQDSADRQWQGLTGLISGFLGGIAGNWGPSIILYLLARNRPRAEMIRMQGLAFGLGAVMLWAGHSISGLFSWPAMLLSALLILPAVLGMMVGQRIQKNINEILFRKAVLMVLMLVGAQILLRGLLI